ncbi:MAG TPA: chemotaxis protein CheB [Candidatus Acidoferrum sp.]|nr:chemotaxis protein CheB [Candidatus Acidoferrum sp.]
MTKKSNRKKKASGKGTNSATDRFIVVAIGASAGGIEAASDLLRDLPADTGLSFVLVQHLDPKHHSILTDLLSKQTAMPVSEVKNRMVIERNHIYVIPPNTSMSISERSLQLRPREESRGVPMPIDEFMRSVAEGFGPHSIGVVLSGSGTDGTLGIAEIQAQGGVTFAQDDATAKYNSMPRSAVNSGCIDYVLPPRQIAQELARIARLPYAGTSVPVDVPVPASDSAALSSIFQTLRRSTGVDFTHYRQTTILRRIQRRMVVHKMEKLDEYVRYLHSHSPEIKALYRDMLINVTSFFRSAPVFDLLKSLVFPSIMNLRSPESVIRVWTPGCASGEETYSVAIALLEFLGDKASQVPIQFFGTDVSEPSVSKARAGTYPENIQGDVSPERLKRFFTRVDGGFRISKSIRDMCIFAQHNVLNDPPFSQMDLICCRNLLIYLEPVLQNKVISLFHYAARPNGYLVLGTSEGVGAASHLFTNVDRSYKVFSKKANTVRQPVMFSLNHISDRVEYGTVRTPFRPPESSTNYLEAQKEFDRRLVLQFAPATVFVNEELEVVHTRGDVSRYLKLSPGRASLNILKMAREYLLIELRNALARARKEGATVRMQHVVMKNGNGNGNVDGSGNEEEHSKKSKTRFVSFDVVPLRLGQSKELYFMIVFQEDSVAVPTVRKEKQSRLAQKAAIATNGRITKLEQELAANKEYLQSVIETQEATNEELQSANEEILSSNEELQSTNEELETAKEELQSANEELSTVNDELRSRNSDVSTANNDLTNLLSSIDLTVVMLGPDATIRRFTPLAQKTLGLIPGDVGRPFLNINPVVRLPNLQQMVRDVIGNAQVIEKEIPVRDGQGYQLRILPYRTAEGKHEGAVVTLVEIFRPPLKSGSADVKDRKN